MGSPRLWLWIGVAVLLLGIFTAIQGGSLATQYGIGYIVGALLPGLAILYLGWYRRRNQA